MGDLNRLMVQFGSPLRQLGFSFDEAAVMFARFEKEGVNMQTLLPGLRMALKNIAVPSDDLAGTFQRLGIATKDPHDALLSIFETISDPKIKAADKTLLASSVFGGRAWADMKAAIEEGRFSFDELIKSMRSGKTTIMGAGRETQDFSERWQVFKNRVMVGLEPLATRVFNTVGKAMESIGEILTDPKLSAGEKIGKLFSGAAEAAGKAAPKVAGAFVTGFINAGIWGQLAMSALLIRGFGGKGAIAGLGARIGAWLGLGISSGAAAGIAGTGGGGAGAAAGGAAAGGLLGKIRAIKWARVGVLGIGLAMADTTINEFATRAKERSGDIFTALEGLGTRKGEVFGLGIEDVFGESDATRNAKELLGLLEEIQSTKTITDSQRAAISDLSRRVGLSSDQLRSMRQAMAAVAQQQFTGAQTRFQGFVQQMISGNRNLRNAAVSNFRNWTGLSGKALAEFVAGSLRKWTNLEQQLGSKNAKIRSNAVSQIKQMASSLGVEWTALVAMIRNKTTSITQWLRTYLQEQLGMDPAAIDAIVARRKSLEGSKGGERHTGLRQGGLAAVVPGHAAGDRQLLSLDGAPVAKVESREGIFVGNRNLMGTLAAANAAVPRFAKGGIVDAQVTGGGSRAAVAKGNLDRGAAAANAFAELAKKMGGGGPKVRRMIEFGKGIAAKHFPYVYGGGHGSFSPPYDCSGFVSAILHAGGLTGTTMTTDSLKGWGEAGPGKQVTIGVRGSTGRSAHTMMRVGRLFFESGSGHGAAVVGGWSGGFPIKRHPPGMQRGGVVDRKLLERARREGIPVSELLNPKSEKFVGWGLQRGGFIASQIKRKGRPFVSTAYGPPWGGIQGTGTTATGIDLHGNPHKYLVAVDPGTIPLHSKLGIWPNPFSYLGAFAAEDTGGAIDGNRIDFYDWRGRGKQIGWGRKTVSVAAAADLAQGPLRKRKAKKGKQRKVPGIPGISPKIQGRIDAMAAKVNELTGKADIWAEFGDRASQLEGLVGGMDEVGWLHREKDTLFALRERLVELHNYLIELQRVVSEWIKRAREHLRGITDKKVRKTIKDRIAAWIEGHGILGTKAGEYRESLVEIQGTPIGVPAYKLLGTLPPVGVLGGRIFDVQSALKQAGEDTSATDPEAAKGLTPEQLKELTYLSGLGVKFDPAQFQGFFAGGGSIGTRQWGIAGETGRAEIIEGPARIHSADDSAAMLGPQALFADIYIGGEKIDERVEVKLRRREREEHGAYLAGSQP